MWSVYFFLVLIVPIVVIWLVVGPKLLLVKSVWVSAGVLLFICGIMIMGGGSVPAVIGGLLFAIAGVIIVITAIKSYTQTQLRWAQERRVNHNKSKAIAALDNLE